jgi:hypothetical protein
MTGAEAQKLAAEGRWVYRKVWKGWYSWNQQYVTHIECLRQDIGEELDWEGETGLVQFKLTALEVLEGEIRWGHVEWRPLNEEDWQHDDWEEFDPLQSES